MIGPGLLVSSDFVERVLATPGSRVPQGLFPRTSMGRKSKGFPAGPAHFIEMLREMLRDLTNLNVRQPSTLAPPFRADNFYYRLGGSFAVPGTPVNVVTWGSPSQTFVPQGQNAVVSAITLLVAQIPTNTVLNDLMDVSGFYANPSRLSVFKNGSGLPGLQGRVATMIDSNEIPGAANTQYLSPHQFMPLSAPLALTQGDVLTFQVSAPVISGAFLVEMSGYLYPIELDGDGVRGTLADRS